MAGSTVELNGKLYDAKTGQPIARSTPKDTPKPAVARTNTGGFIDGVRRVKGSKPQLMGTMRAAAKQVAQTAKKPISRPSTSAQKVHKRQQKATVLLRRAVKPPAKKPAIQAVAAPVAAKPKASPLHERAKQIQKSERISRFGAVRKPLAPIKREEAVSETKTVAKRPVETVATRKAPVPSRKEQLLAEGLAKAQSHHEHSPKTKSKKRAWHFVVTSVAGLLVIGYVVYLQLPNMAMKVAAAKAGFSANLPSYNPGGFRLKGPISYSPGQITIGYRSNTDDREYNITQKKSSWDSESLLSNVVTEKPDYQTYRDHGLTIYVYGGSNATWVNSGVWYTIDGSSQLSAQQIVKIAASM